MLFWIVRDESGPLATMCVDNAVVINIDISSIPSDVVIIQWRDGIGEIEKVGNGLRENFIDITPYCDFFQVFLPKVTSLGLDQAKKVQNDLIREIYESKRQAPYHHSVAAGDYWWDATDQTLISSTVPAIQNLTATLNSLISKTNAVVSALKGVDASLTVQGNSLCSTINSYIATPGTTAFGSIAIIFAEVNTRIVNHLNNTVLGTYGDTINTINNKLRSDGTGAGPGLTGNIAHASAIESFSGVMTTIPGMFAPGAASWTDQASVSTATIQWIPIGGTVAVAVTLAEQAAILNGIAARSNDLQMKKTTKIGEVNALITIPEVIAYDVTMGW